MAAAEFYSGACMECVPQHLLAPDTLRRVRTEQIGERTEGVEVTQGRIMWLPPMEDLPERAVRRAHGKGAVEDAIYNHPVVVVSRPLDDEQVVHFHLITSLQGKRLDQLYPKSNEFHTSRRSWYLPISPSPNHPDANSKKTKKRFPTLVLGDGATLRWDSYVNIRNVYKISWTLLKPYVNHNIPKTSIFCLEAESTARMIAKGKILTLYEPNEQVPCSIPQPVRARTAPLHLSTELHSATERGMHEPSSPVSGIETVASPAPSAMPSPSGSIFRPLDGNGNRGTDQPPEEPPAKTKRSFLDHLRNRLCMCGLRSFDGD